MVHDQIKTVLSLFSGCGGMDLGFEGDFDLLDVCVNNTIHSDWIARRERPHWVRVRSTGFKTVFANDISRSAMSAWIPYFTKRGIPSDAFHLGSIVDLIKSAKSGRRNIFPSSVDVVTGGFPCQDFSIAGKRKWFASHKNHAGIPLSNMDDPTFENRGMLYVWMRRTIELVRPKVFVAENVKGLINLADAKSTIENDFRNIGDGGYLVVNAKLLNAAQYGVPQSRERVIFIGLRKSLLKPEVINELSQDSITKELDPYPVPTHTLQYRLRTPIKRDDLLPYVTVRDVIGDLCEPEDTYDLSQASYSKARWYGDHCQGQTEVNLDSIGPTIRAEHHGNIEFRRLAKEHGGHMNSELDSNLKERRLTVRECARLQTLPDDYEFVRKAHPANSELSLSASEAYRLIGNAVPPLLVYHIAWRLNELWPLIFKEY